jgi:hypothetical protein
MQPSRVIDAKPWQSKSIVNLWNPHMVRKSCRMDILATPTQYKNYRFPSKSSATSCGCTSVPVCAFAPKREADPLPVCLFIDYSSLFCSLRSTFLVWKFVSRMVAIEKLRWYQSLQKREALQMNKWGFLIALIVESCIFVADATPFSSDIPSTSGAESLVKNYVD